MKVSIVTLSFNQGRFLERAMRSVVDQGDVDLDYILVDRGSTDNSFSIVENYQGQLSQVIRERDDEPSEALNNGFSCADGDIFGVLNADAALRPGALARVVQAFHDHPKADVIAGHGHLIDADDNMIRRMYSDRFSLWGYLYGGVVLLQSSTFFRRQAFETAGGFNVANRTCWENELWLDMALAGKRFARVNEFWSESRARDLRGVGPMMRREDHRAAYERDQRRMFLKARGRLPGGLKDGSQRLAARAVKWGSNPAALSAHVVSLLSQGARRSPM